MSAQHTPGPWRWELNLQHRQLELCGGRPRYDLTILEPRRWGMNSATLRLRDTAVDGLNIMLAPHEVQAWTPPFAGEEHHAHWRRDLEHPDARLIACAPELLEALEKAHWMLAAVGCVGKEHAAREELILRARCVKPTEVRP